MSKNDGYGGAGPSSPFEEASGGPAFPCETYHGSPVPGGAGMSLRDYFAATADIKDYSFDTLAQAEEITGIPMPSDPASRGELIQFAMKIQAWFRYQYADAMLAARNKGE